MATAEIVKECRVCFEIYMNPKLLPCRHSLCEACVNKVKKGSKIQCPTCKSFSDVDKIVHDFRLEEFIQALTEQEEEFTRLLGQAAAAATSTTPSAPPEPEVTAPSKCELCDLHDIAFWCNDCEQWICSSCEKTHLKIKSCANHRVEKLSNKAKEVTLSLKTQVQNLRRKITEFQQCVTAYQSEMNKTQDTQRKTLQQSRKLRDECVRELKKCFDRIDNTILADTDNHSKKLEREKSKHEKRVRDMERECKKFEDIINQKNPKLVLDGAAIVKSAKDLVEAVASPCVNIESISLQLRRLQAWSAQAVTLDVTGGRITHRTAVTASESLEQVSGRQWRRQHSVAVPYYPHCLRYISGQLYQCHVRGITVYSADLQLLNTIALEDLGCVNDVAGTPGGELVVASGKGLHHMTATGARRVRMSEGHFTGVVRHGDRYYAVNINTCTVHVYTHHSGSWSQCHSFSIDATKDYSITLCIANEQLYACLSVDHRVDILSLSGQRQCSTGSEGSGAAGQLNYPLICATDTAGAALIADSDNSRLQVLSARRQWSTVTLQPPVEGPYSAQLLHGKLYVNEYDNKTLCLYEMQ